jgi:uncharacterized protein YndB with AHSA1/START domain
MRSSYRSALLAVSCAVGLSSVGHAAVLAAGAGGFTVREEVQFSGTPELAWRHLLDVGSWWSAEHTYSGKSSNLSITLGPGPRGCWCERLDQGGFARHLEVVLVMPQKTLRLSGGLGPLQAMGVSGALTFTLRSAAPGTTTVVAEYAVAGYSREGLGGLAGAVDGVLGEAMARFAKR